MAGTRIGDLVRKARRRLYRRARRRGAAELAQLEDNQLHAYYQAIAGELGLSFLDFGRCRGITDGKTMFHLWGVGTDFASIPLIGIAEDKEFINQFFAARGYPVPKGQAFDWRDEAAALRFAASLGGPCVVKPAADTDGGEGVTTNITSAAAALTAFRRAGALKDRVLIEEHVAGENFRVLIYKGRCLSVLHRQRPKVVGDGRRSIADLIAQANSGRIQGADWAFGDPQFFPIPLDPQARDHLARQGLSPSHTPADGQVVVISDICNYSRGGTFREVADAFNPRIVDDLVRAAGELGMTLAGFDVIAEDLGREIYVINEVNVGPGLQTHYFIDNADEGRDPIREILRDVFELDRSRAVA